MGADVEQKAPGWQGERQRRSSCQTREETSVTSRSMKPFFLLSLLVASLVHAQDAAPEYPRPLHELNTSYFPFNRQAATNWEQRRKDIRNRILLSCGLYPLPTKTPLNPVIHGTIERDDYTIDRVFFESFPGHFVTGNLYRPKNKPKDGKMPGVLCPHGHWPNGRFMDTGKDTPATNEQLAIGAERWENGARSPLQARCVQLARMGCAVFFYDMLGYADSIQIAEHRSGKRPDLDGKEPGTFGLYSAAADLRLQSNFGLQTWNSVRALDFILGLDGIDPKRISCTGASGGGTQTMILAAIDDRLATAFPCVMVSTAMQGGCTCENTCYLRIGQGNIDIAAAFAPKPMGMTAADDWTVDLERKGFPDLQAIWKQLGKPENVTAFFNTHFKHNYNHVSRGQMYGFMNKHFKLGGKEPVLERDFVLSTTEELTVWTAEHPKPTGDQVGGAHEKALLKHWSEDNDKVVATTKGARASAWQIMIGRTLPKATEVSFDLTDKEEIDNRVVLKGTVRNTLEKEEVPCTFIGPKEKDWKGTVVVWLTSKGVASFGGEAGPLPDEAKKLIDAGIAIASPTLYLPEAKENPHNPVKSKDAARNEWQWSACYTYGYNPTLLASRVHDVLNLVAMMKNHPDAHPKRIIIAGSEGMGPVAAAAGAILSKTVQGVVIDTESFRFADLKSQWHPMFVPGAVKYGDMPGLLDLCKPAKVAKLGEDKIPGGSAAVVEAVLKMEK